MKHLKYTMLFLAVLAALPSCEKSASEVYESKVFLDNYSSVRTLYISIENSYTETLVAALPRPAEKALKVEYLADEAKVAEYNERYGTEAIMLPEANYSFSAPSLTIDEGGVRSAECVISFKDILTLDGKQLYVLPVSLKSEDIGVLASRSTKYYVFEGAKLINDAAYMWDNYCEVDWQNTEPVSNLKQFTVEMLMNCDWDGNKTRRANNQNNSFFGIEGYFLFRTGDLSYPNNLLQVCTNSGEPRLGIMPKNEWFHLAVTYDCDTRQIVMYVNGKRTATATAGYFANGVTFATADAQKEDVFKNIFHINTAYDQTRTADAIFSEVRIWNKILDEETLKEQKTRPYFVDPSAAEGLVAYWKFNEGSGDVVYDRSGNNNNLLKFKKSVKWVKVSLPED